MAKALPVSVLQNTRFAAELVKQAALTSGFARLALLNACSLQCCQALTQFVSHLSGLNVSLASFRIESGEVNTSLIEISQLMRAPESWFCFWRDIEASLSCSLSDWESHSLPSDAALIASNVTEYPRHWTKVDLSVYSEAIDGFSNFVHSHQALQSEY